MSDQTHTQFLRYERTEAALRLSEATKTAILEAALDCIVTIDHKGEVVDWNPAAERTFGYNFSEAIGREMAALIIPDRMQEMHRRGLARAMTSNHELLGGKRIEIVARRKNGEEFPVELAITRISGVSPLFTGHIRDISDRKQAERALRESQQLLSSITRNITEAIFRRSQSEGLVFVNEAYAKMFGYGSGEEVRTIPPEKFYARAARRAEIVKLLERDGMLRNEEIEYCRKDGSTFWGLTSATGIRDDSGKIIYFDGAINDITERKMGQLRQAAQFAVAQALANSNTLTEAAPKILEAVCTCLSWDLGTIWQLDATRKVLKCVDLWHRKTVSLKQFDAATLDTTFTKGVGLPGRIWEKGEPGWISDVMKDKNFPRAPIAAQCGLHGAFGFPIRLGKEVLGIIEFFSQEIRQPDKQLLEMFSTLGSQIGQFIERKRAEEDLRNLNKDLENRVTARTAELVGLNQALKVEETRYRTLAEHTPAAIVVLDTQTGRFIEANENAVQLFGLARTELLRVGPAEVSPANQPDGTPSGEGARHQIKKALSGNVPVFEWTHLHSSGKTIPCEVRVAQMPSTGGNLVIGAITDITARRKAEAELRMALEQEKELHQLKSNFVNMVSHEFRTPLGVIMSSADILESYFDRLNPDQRHGYLQDVRHSTQQMTRLMEEVLLLGRVESGKNECKPDDLDLHDFCNRLAEEQLAASGNKCPINLQLQIANAQTRADEGLLRHILTNLISNAIKYSPAGCQIHFSVRTDGQDAVFEIRDYGIGIPIEDQPRLFEAFHRGNNVADIPGTGLGMVIVKRCVDLHGGHINVESSKGAGTKFSVRLPLFTHRPKTNRAKPKPVKNQ